MLFNTISFEINNRRYILDDSDRDIGMKIQKFKEVRVNLELRLKVAHSYFGSVSRL